MTERNRWLPHIKQVRTEHGVALFAAERIALADPSWCRWVEHRINGDVRCRRMALRHIRMHGADALIEKDGDRLRVVVRTMD